MNITVTISIVNKVNLEEDASQTVRLELGCIEDGNKKGNKAKPNVLIIPIWIRALHSIRNLYSGVVERINVNIAPLNPKIGAIQNEG